MADLHTLPLKTDDYLADTRHLTAAQHGAYLLLLMMAWRSPDNALPNDDLILAKWAAMDLRSWRRHKEIIMGFWTLGTDARWRQRRLDVTRKMVADLLNKKSSAGKASALKNKQRRSTPVENASQQIGDSVAESESESESEIASLQLARENGVSERLVPEQISDEVLPSSWQDIAEARSVPNEQIFRSWGRFKEKSEFPYQAAKWEAWINKEIIGGRSNA